MGFVSHLDDAHAEERRATILITKQHLEVRSYVIGGYLVKQKDDVIITKIPYGSSIRCEVLPAERAVWTSDPQTALPTQSADAANPPGPPEPTKPIVERIVSLSKSAAKATQATALLAEAKASLASVTLAALKRAKEDPNFVKTLHQSTSLGPAVQLPRYAAALKITIEHANPPANPNAPPSSTATQVPPTEVYLLLPERLWDQKSSLRPEQLLARIIKRIQAAMNPANGGDGGSGVIRQRRLSRRSGSRASSGNLSDSNLPSFPPR